MVILPLNIKGQILKLLLLGLFGVAIYTLLTYSIPQTHHDGTSWFLYLMVGGLSYLVVLIGASCGGVNRVCFDPRAGTVSFRRWWSITTVPLAALSGYHALTYWSPRSGPGPPGWVLETNDGRRFKLEPINLHDLPLLEGALTGLGLQCGAPERVT